MEIAILVGPGGDTAPIQTPGEIQVFRYTCNTWEICRSLPFSIPTARGLSGMREYLQTVIEFLGDCRHFVGSSVAGLPFFELEKAGVTSWEFAGYPFDFLDVILKSEVMESELSALPEQAPPILPRLQEISPGCYLISLIEIQNCSGNITSKQVLLPILTKQNFSQLEIICSHVPPWLELKILSGEIDATIEKRTPQESRIVIRG